MTPYKCPQCAAHWYGKRNGNGRPVCAECGSRLPEEAKKK